MILIISILRRSLREKRPVLPSSQALSALAMEDKLQGGADFFDKFRLLVLTGYFTSEVGITQEREYVPVQARYDGALSYTPGTKVYSL